MVEERQDLREIGRRNTLAPESGGAHVLSSTFWNQAPTCVLSTVTGTMMPILADSIRVSRNEGGFYSLS
jgi:hypothetical protein